MLAEIDRLRLHVKDNIIHYMQAIWTTSRPTSAISACTISTCQSSTTTRPWSVKARPSGGGERQGAARRADTRTSRQRAAPHADAVRRTEEAAPGRRSRHLIGFKGNYMIFPDRLRQLPDLVHDAATTSNSTTSRCVPVRSRPGRGRRPHQSRCGDREPFTRKPAKPSDNTDKFRKSWSGSSPTKTQQLVVVPTTALHRGAARHASAPGGLQAHPPSARRKKVQAEVRHAELENSPAGGRGSRMVSMGDPDIDKVVVVGDNKNVTIDAGE